MPSPGKEVASIDVLLDELLLGILQQLSSLDWIRVERVSKRWQRIARSCWKRERRLRLGDVFEKDEEFLDVRDCNRVLFGLLQRCGPFLHSLDISQSFCSSVQPDFSDRAFRAIGRYCPGVTSLDLSYLSLSNAQLLILAAELTLVEHLWLVRSFEDEDEPDEGLAVWLKDLSHLKSLDLSLNDGLSGQCLSFLPPGLLDLSLNRCSGLTAASLALAAQRCRSLRRLELSRTSRDVRKALQIWTELRHINLNSAEVGFTLTSISSSLSRLRSLDLGHSLLVTSHTISVISECATELEELKIHGKFGVVHAISLEPLKRLRKLKVLDVSWLQHLRDRDLLAVAESGALERLSIHLCDELTSEGLLEVVQQSPRLSYLDATGCKGANVAFLRGLSNICNERKRALRLHMTRATLDEPAYVLHSFSHAYLLILGVC